MFSDALRISLHVLWRSLYTEKCVGIRSRTMVLRNYVSVLMFNYSKIVLTCYTISSIL